VEWENGHVQANQAAVHGTVPGVTADSFIRTEHVFGSAKPDGTAVTDAEAAGFLDREITRASRMA
jgi:hypothetical protein